MRTKLSRYIKYLADKKILIYGLGLQGGGADAVKFFSRYASAVRVTDLKLELDLTPTLEALKNFNLTYTLGQHKKTDILWADIIIVNSDIWNKAPKSPYLRLAFENHKKIETQIGLFLELCECPVIGVTGSKGKTTVTTAIGELLSLAGMKIMVGGNIPDSMTLSRIEETSQLDYAVLELSNFQLRGLHLKKLSPDIAVITSISPDHLISYQDFPSGPMQAYLKDKQAIFKYQLIKDYLLIRSDLKKQSAFLKGLVSQLKVFSKHTIPKNWDLVLSGEHNRENMGAVYLVGKILSLNDGIIKKGITNFSGVKYRLEKIGTKKGITFINDTTATTPSAAIVALKSFPKRKIIWIGGGNTKNLPQKELLKVINHTVKQIILLKGTGTDKLISDFKKLVPSYRDIFLGIYDNLKMAVNDAYKCAKSGDYILLSPGFTSFGMFRNEFERGKLFNQFVKEIIKSK